MSQKVITPVGTSLFTNYMEKSNTIKTDYGKIENKPASKWTAYAPHIERIRKDVTASWAKKKLNRTPPEIDASAEITSLIKIQEEVNDDLEVCLIATETVVSRLAAEILQDLLHDRAFPNGRAVQARFIPDKDVIKGLQVNNRNRFEKEGMVELVRRIEEITGGYYENTILNMTGGYKATIPYLTVMGQLKNMAMYYTFEDPPYELIKIPQTPIDMNWRLFEKYSHVFAQLSEGVEQTWETFAERHHLHDDLRTCVYEEMIDDQPLIGLNAFGEMFWTQYQYFFVVHIPMGSKYFREEANRKRDLRKAFQELYRRLMKITEPLKTLTDSDLKHAVIEDSYIYKHSSPQIRIQYRFDQNKQLYIYNYLFIKSSQNDRMYSAKMTREYPELKNDHGALITLKKEV